MTAHLRWTSSGTSKDAAAITAGLCQKHFLFEYPNKTKSGLIFVNLFHPSISFISNPSSELSNVRSNKLLHFTAVSFILEAKNLKTPKLFLKSLPCSTWICKISISNVRVKKRKKAPNITFLLIREYSVLSLPAKNTSTRTVCTQKLLNV